MSRSRLFSSANLVQEAWKPWNGVVLFNQEAEELRLKGTKTKSLILSSSGHRTHHRTGGFRRPICKVKKINKTRTKMPSVNSIIFLNKAASFKNTGIFKVLSVHCFQGHPIFSL